MRIRRVDTGALAEVVWRYHHMGHALLPSDCIVVLGSHDTRVAARGAEVFLAGYAPIIVFSGNVGALTRGAWTRPEAEVFAGVAERMGVPRECMLLESRSTNTGENVDFTRALLESRGIRPRRMIAVQKPYMERRTYATFRARWPETDVLVTSPQLSFEEYRRTPPPSEPGASAGAADWERQFFDVMLGDLERLVVYGERGWSEPQQVPGEVMDAFRRLVEAGYTRRLLGRIK